jgi:hypothetical protein
MERSNFFTYQFVTSANLNNIETTKISQIIDRTQGRLDSYNVCGSAADTADASKNLYVLADSPQQITVSPGVALDIDGELIVLHTYKTMKYGNSDIHYSWPAGSVSATNYVKLRYQEASSSLQCTAAGVAYYTKYAGDYYLKVDSVAPTSYDVLLATFLADSAGSISGNISDQRTYVKLRTTASSSVLDPTTIVYMSGHTNLEDHVRATGSTTPSITNAHGLYATDIGAAISPAQIPLIPTNTTNLAIDGVYQNPSGSTMFLSCSIRINDDAEHYSSGNINWVAMEMAESGSIGTYPTTGYLTPPVYETSLRQFSRITSANDSFTLISSLRGFVPPHWFYRVGFPSVEYFTFYPTHSGSVRSTLRYH